MSINLRFISLQHDEGPPMFDSEQQFIFLRLNILREYLERELLMTNLPFKYDFEVNFGTYFEIFKLQFVLFGTLALFLLTMVKVKKMIGLLIYSDSAFIMNWINNWRKKIICDNEICDWRWKILSYIPFDNLINCLNFDLNNNLQNLI